MLPDQSQREEALDVSRSFIVQAPAGSGKTELLTQRYIRLLNSSHIQHPEEIIAITFTRKAAAQMRHRVISQINHAEPRRLRIMTIDAFCTFLNTQMPLHAKCAANFSIAEYPEKIYRRAIQNLFLNYPTMESFKKFLLYLDNDIAKVQHLLTDILKCRDQWLCFLPMLIKENAVRSLEDAWQNWGHAYSPEQTAFVEALSEVLIYLIVELKKIFDETQEYDFVEITLKALEALGSLDAPTDLALKLDYQIKHLLIDEFQDTSSSQWRLCQKLIAGWEPNDGRTLFLVGDPMQSIYRFRKAEVSLFLDVQKHGLGHIPIKPLTLSTNFRSHPKLIDWYNETFQIIFPKKSNLLLGAVSYTPSYAGTEPKDNSYQEKKAYHHAIDLEHNSSHETDVILEIVANNPDKKIAILARSRSHFKKIVPALQKANIAFKAVDLVTLADHPLIQDLFALTRALWHLGDRIAWLSLLRAPWCGCDLKLLHDIAGHDHGNEKTIWELLCAWQEKIKTHPLKTEAEQRLFATLSVLNDCLNCRGKISLSEWVEHTWNALKGPMCLSTTQFSQECQIAENFFDCLNQIKSSEDMISQLETLLNTISVSNNYQPESPSQKHPVELMTIHKAKGLEFDVVILPSLEKMTRADQSRLFLWEERINADGKLDLLVAPMPSKKPKSDCYIYLKEAEAKRSEEELKRLFYVAATRAKESLHLLYCINIKSVPKKSFLYLLMPLLSDDLVLKNKIKSSSAVLKLDYLKHLPSEFFGNPIEKKQEMQNTSFTLKLFSDLQQRSLGTVVHEILYLLSKNISVSEEYCRNRCLQLSGTTEKFEMIQSCLSRIQECPKAQWILKSHQEAKSEFALTTSQHIGGKTEYLNIVIDRTFVDENQIRWIIDYKTTEEILPEKYRAQLEKYAKAISEYSEKNSNRPIHLGIYSPLTSEWIEWVYRH